MKAQSNDDYIRSLRQRAVSRAAKKYEISEDEVMSRLRNGEVFELTRDKSGDFSTLELDGYGRATWIAHLTPITCSLCSAWFSGREEANE